MDEGVAWLLAGYALVIAFSVAERTLRRGQSAKTFERGSFDRGSTVLIGAAFASALSLPLILDLLGMELFSVELFAGLLALLVMAFGIALRLWAAKTLGEYYTRTLLTTEKQRVVVTGPYAVIRHPGYLGGVLMWSGFGVLSGNWIVSLLLPVMFIAVYLYRIGVEEKMLLEAVGEEYVQYRSKTWKLVPFVY